MKTSEKTDIALPLSPATSQADAHAVMPEEFAGMYQAGFECGYSSGRDAGYRQGLEEGYAAVHQRPKNGSAVTVAEAKTAPKGGPRRMLLGMPCTQCKIYLYSGETHCPGCGRRK